MADFMTAVLLTLKNEGGYVDNPNDPGGATNMGVKQRDLPDVPIKELTQAQAIEYYDEYFWDPEYSLISSQALANKLFDMGVLFGRKTVVELLQRTLGIEQDGVFGPNTLQKVNAAYGVLLAYFKSVLLTHATLVVVARPSDQEFIDGWNRRINS